MSFRNLCMISAASLGALAMMSMPAAVACTSLAYTDANGDVYFGRTLELQMELPYQLVYLPAGVDLESVVDGQPELDYTTHYAIFGIAMPARIPGEGEQLGLEDLKPLEAVNEAGLTFSLLAYPSVEGPQHMVEGTQAVLSAIDLGAWALGQFATVDEVKTALADQPVRLEPLAMLGGAQPPIHFVLHDRAGASIVIEWHQGNMMVYDNPVGVMTNGPQFSWHLTNLNNYTFLSNVDQSTGQFGGLAVSQPDSGIATAGLPSSNTSVGRFVRAVYYSQFAEKVDDPDQAVRTLSHIMNNFDRPRGITIDETGGGEGDAIAALAPADASGYTTEYTSWTTLHDLERGLFFVRTYAGLNYTMFDLGKLAGQEVPLVMPLSALDGMAGDGTELLTASHGQQ